MTREQDVARGPQLRDSGTTLGEEEQPHVQGAVAVGVQEGQEELLHIQGQEGRP